MGLFDFLKPKKTGIDGKIFSSPQYQLEILAFARMKYFENSQRYEAVNAALENEGLNKEQVFAVVQHLKQANAAMTNEFQQELDSGRISDIKIIPNPEHNAGNVDGDQADKYTGYGAWQMDRGDLENALELFDKALELDPQATLAWANKGTLYSRKGDPETALHFYNKALEIEPNQQQVLENKMELMIEMLNESNEAEFIDTVKAILKNDPGQPNALAYIIQFQLKQNEIENALTDVKKLFANYHSEGIAIQLLLDTFHRLPRERALAEFEQFRPALNEQAAYQLTYCKGLFLKALGEHEQATGEFLNLNKTHEFSWNYYQVAIIKNIQHKKQECLDYLKITFRLEPALKADARKYPELENLWTDSDFIALTS